jgi:hypothetical protein
MQNTGMNEIGIFVILANVFVFGMVWWHHRACRSGLNAWAKNQHLMTGPGGLNGTVRAVWSDTLRKAFATLTGSIDGQKLIAQTPAPEFPVVNLEHKLALYRLHLYRLELQSEIHHVPHSISLPGPPPLW